MLRAGLFVIILRKAAGTWFIYFWIGYATSQAFALDLSGVVVHDDGATPFVGA
jgi:hypothetical protein